MIDIDDFIKYVDEFLNAVDSNKHSNDICDSCEYEDCDYCDEAKFEDIENEFVFPDIVEILRENPNLMARDKNDKLYAYRDGFIQIMQDESFEWIPFIKPRITEDLLYSKFTLEPIEECVWEGIPSLDILGVLAVGEGFTGLRVVFENGDSEEISHSELKMLTIREIIDFDWQIKGGVCIENKHYKPHTQSRGANSNSR